MLGVWAGAVDGRLVPVTVSGRRTSYSGSPSSLASTTTDIDYTVVREGKNLRSWLIGALLATAGRKVLVKAFDGFVKAIEARSGTPS